MMTILILKIFVTGLLCLISYAHFQGARTGYYLTSGVFGFNWIEALLPTGISGLLLFWIWR